MADIDIRRAHGTTLAAARVVAERVVAKLSQDFDLKHHWEGNTVVFERSGLSGRLALTDKDVAITVKLSLLLRAIKGRIEREVLSELDQQFRR